MPGQSGSITYSLLEPFDQAVESIRRSLLIRGLRVVGQLDVSRRIERSLEIVLPPCRILFVLPNLSELSSSSIHPWAAIFLPFHIVISGNEANTEIQLQNRVRPFPEAHAKDLLAPILETQAQLAAAIEAIAMRPNLVA